MDLVDDGVPFHGNTPVSAPRRALPALPLSAGEVAGQFPKTSRGKASVVAFAYWAMFYGGFALYVGHRLPAWLFATVGVFVFVRYFDATHEEIHCRQQGPRVWDALRIVFSVCGPLQLGYTQLAINHRRHHAHEGTARDPDLWLVRTSLPLAIFRSLTQPEQAVIRYIKENGVDRRLAIDLMLHFGLWLGLAGWCSWQQFLVYNAVVRVGNGASWLVFTHVLHRPGVYRSFEEVVLPSWLRTAWLVLIGGNNLNAITYHYLHHAYGFVPSRRLPELRAHLAAARPNHS